MTLDLPDFEQPDLLATTAITTANLQRGGCDVGFFAVRWSVEYDHIVLSVRLGMPGLSKSWRETIHFGNPTIELSEWYRDPFFRTQTGGRIRFHLDDRSGKLHASAEFKVANAGHSASTTVQVFPAYGAGLLYAGVIWEGITDHANTILDLGASYQRLEHFKHIIDTAARDHGVGPLEIYHTFKEQAAIMDPVLKACETLSSQTLREINALSAEQITTAVVTVLQHPDFLRHFPGLDETLDFGGLSAAPSIRSSSVIPDDTGESQPRTAEEDTIKILKELGGIFLIGGLVVASLAAIIIALAVAIMVVTSGAASAVAIALLIAGIVVGVAGFVFIGVGLVLLFIAFNKEHRLRYVPEFPLAVAASETDVIADGWPEDGRFAPLPEPS